MIHFLQVVELDAVNVWKSVFFFIKCAPIITFGVDVFVIVLVIVIFSISFHPWRHYRCGLGLHLRGERALLVAWACPDFELWPRPFKLIELHCFWQIYLILGENCSFCWPTQHIVDNLAIIDSVKVTWKLRCQKLVIQIAIIHLSVHNFLLIWSIVIIPETGLLNVSIPSVKSARVRWGSLTHIRVDVNESLFHDHIVVIV